MLSFDAVDGPNAPNAYGVHCPALNIAHLDSVLGSWIRQVPDQGEDQDAYEPDEEQEYLTDEAERDVEMTVRSAESRTLHKHGVQQPDRGQQDQSDRPDHDDDPGHAHQPGPHTVLPSPSGDAGTLALAWRKKEGETDAALPAVLELKPMVGKVGRGERI
jgi:hypothetical protein